MGFSTDIAVFHRSAPARRAGLAWLLAFVVAWLWPAQAVLAHDIPNDVRLIAFIQPQGQRLTVLVRVPMAALREIDVPLRPGGFVDLPRAEPALREAAERWLLDNLTLLEDDRPLPRPTIERLRITLPADRSFTSLERARAVFDLPRLRDDEQITWNQPFLDVWLQTPLSRPGAALSVEPRFARLGLRVAIALHVQPEGSPERVFELHGDLGLVHLDPRWHQAALRFVQSGFWHILDGTDHLLFLACLVIPLRRLRPLVILATTFTVAHSITLVATALGLTPQGLWFPPLVETVIAASILWMALANIVGGDGHRRWVLAFAFGLVHGFGFAFALQETLQFAGSHVLSALMAFNLGVEIGQIATLVVMVPLVSLLLRRVPERLGVILLSALAAHTAWHWMGERWETLAKFPLPVPGRDDLAALLAWATALLLIAGGLWTVRGRMSRWMSADERAAEAGRPAGR